MDFLLKAVKYDPARFTYLGIGSCPHVPKPSDLSPRYDQLLPAFVDSSRYSTIRVLHIDPCFDLKQQFIEDYFREKGFVGVRESPTLWSYHKEGVEVLVLADSIDHREHYSFFQELVDLILSRASFLVVQEYTGYSTQALFERLCRQAENKFLFRARILFDITQGTDVGCCTDLTKFTVPYDIRGNLVSYLGRPLDEIASMIGIDEQIDRCLRRYLVGIYRGSLNSYHVDYRRRIRGEAPFTQTAEYSDQSEPKLIMSLLKEKLVKVCRLLVQLQVMTAEELATLEQLFLSYEREDVYKWYDKAFKILSPRLLEM